MSSRLLEHAGAATRRNYAIRLAGAVVAGFLAVAPSVLPVRRLDPTSRTSIVLEIGEPVTSIRR